MWASRLCIVRMSLTRGIRPSVTGSLVNKHAASAGNAEFFAPLAATEPRSAVPPSIKNLSMMIQNRLFHIPARGLKQPLRLGPLHARRLGDDADRPVH